ncbi:hypothetical protein SDJN02_15341, partial [Cucurbita argyrosperma subsp. argyrosperma]
LIEPTLRCSAVTTRLSSKSRESALWVYREMARGVRDARSWPSIRYLLGTIWYGDLSARYIARNLNKMAVVSKTRSTLEGLVRDSSLKWLLGNRSFFDEELEEIERSPSAQRNWISELSPFANVVVRRCSKILGVSASELQESFNVEAIDSIKGSSNYARNFLEYCSFRALAVSTHNTGYLADKKFRRLTFDMMIAWEAPASSSQPELNIAEDASVGVEAFSRIAPAVPIISNVIISENIFEVLTTSAGARLQFSVYDKYLSSLEK